VLAAHLVLWICPGLSTKSRSLRAASSECVSLPVAARKVNDVVEFFARKH